MDTWVKDIIGLTLAFDSILIVGIAGWSIWLGTMYDNTREYIYKNYNYDFKGTLEEVKNEPASN